MRYDKSINYVDIWNEDKRGVIATMYRNLYADLSCGYDPTGAAITRQRAEIDQYIKAYNAQLDNFVNMSDEQTNKFCYYDMIKRGVIE